MPKFKNTKNANNKTRSSRSCKIKDVILSSSDRDLTKVKTRSEKSSKTVTSSTPVKSSPNASSSESFDSNGENLTIPLSPISTCSTIKEKSNSKEVRKCKPTTRKRLGDIFDDNNAREPKWKQVRRRTYTRETSSTSSETSSTETEDPFSLFSRPDEHQSKIKTAEIEISTAEKTAEISKVQKKAPPKSKKIDRKFEKEFEDWCKLFSEDLEVAAQTELIIE